MRFVSISFERTCLEFQLKFNQRLKRSCFRTLDWLSTNETSSALFAHHQNFLAICFNISCLNPLQRPFLWPLMHAFPPSCLRFSTFVRLLDTFLLMSLRASAQARPLMCNLRAVLKPFSRVPMYSCPQQNAHFNGCCGLQCMDMKLARRFFVVTGGAFFTVYKAHKTQVLEPLISVQWWQKEPFPFDIISLFSIHCRFLKYSFEQPCNLWFSTFRLDPVHNLFEALFIASDIYILLHSTRFHPVNKDPKRHRRNNSIQSS